MTLDTLHAPLKKFFVIERVIIHILDVRQQTSNSIIPCLHTNIECICLASMQSQSISISCTHADTLFAEMNLVSKCSIPFT